MIPLRPVVILASLAGIALGFVKQPSPGVLNLRLQQTFDGKAVEWGDVRYSAAGAMVGFTRNSLLLSGFQLQSDDGHSVSVDTVCYLNPQDGADTCRLEVPEGKNWKQLSFNVGVPPALNHSDPSKRGPNDPLNPTVNAMHWGWQGGYIFSATEGKWEQPGSRLSGFVYHVANDPNLMRVTLPISAASGQSVVLSQDLAKVMRGVYLGKGDDQASTHSAKDDPLAKLLTQNIAHSFSFVRSEALNSQPATPKAMPLPTGTHAYEMEMPDGFPQPSLPLDNPLTVEGVRLGHRLFWDPILSRNRRAACINCHRSEFAYSDGGHPVSRGDDGTKGTRKAPPLFNLAWSKFYTWDGRRTRLRDQALAPIQDKHEMNLTLGEVVQRLNELRTYREEFKEAFGSPGITAERVSLALEQFLLTRVSGDSKFDQARRDQATLSDLEKEGLVLFITEFDPARGKRGADCFHCHGGNLFSDYAFHDNGLRPTKDEGRARATGRQTDIGKFKTPSLRNLALSGPYMHDGRFKTLQEVIDHYSEHISQNANLDPNIAKHPVEGIRLSPHQKKALIAFLNTLNEPDFEFKDTQ
ncbi:MAG: cytochrome C peroxidase [Armatimonadetes bacterium]|nr:cytochrome C peroxidase [Armatimonadota bacterium]